MVTTVVGNLELVLLELKAQDITAKYFFVIHLGLSSLFAPAQQAWHLHHHQRRVNDRVRRVNRPGYVYQHEHLYQKCAEAKCAFGKGSHLHRFTPESPKNPKRFGEMYAMGGETVPIHSRELGKKFKLFLSGGDESSRLVKSRLLIIRIL